MPSPLVGVVLSSVVAMLALTVAGPAHAQNAKAHKSAAERAIVKERWCEALFLYAKLDEVDPNAEWALQAADAAQFADDRARALALYQSALKRAPKHPRARAMEQSITALEKLISKSGAGTACGLPTPECGNGVVEGSETCDDGNRSSGDTCPATCTGTSPTAKPATALPALPVPPVVIPPVVPVPVPVPVKPAPVVTPPPPPPPPATKTAPVVTPPPAPPTPPPAKTEATLPVQRSSEAGGSGAEGAGTLCTLIKPVKAFVKGDWKTFEFGSTLTIKSVGPQWTMIETPNGDGGKVAASVMEGACGKEEPAPAKVTPSTTTPVQRSPDPIKFDDEPATDPRPEPSKIDEPVEPKVEEPSKIEDEPKDEPATDTNKIEPLKSEGDPASTAPEVEEAEGGGIGGWLVLGVGALFTVGGGAAAVWGSLPYFEYTRVCEGGFGTTTCPALEAIGQDYRGETDPEDRAALADDAADLRKDVDNAAQAWDEGGSGGIIPTGRFVMAGGAGAAGLGVGLIVTGLIIALSGGEESEEGEESEDEEEEGAAE